MKNQVYILLGGNQGDVKKTFARARALIEQEAGEIKALSALYKTEPWGFEAKEHFLNQVLHVSTHLDPGSLLEKLLEIETTLGRTRSGEGYSSRNIDIDILFYNDCILETEKLTLPHPRMHLRNFALEPMTDVSPGFVHPVLKQTIVGLRDASPDDSRVFALPENSTT